MLDAAKAISSFVRGRSFEDYVVDRMLRSAVERQVEIYRRGGSVYIKLFQTFDNVPKVGDKMEKI